MRFARDVVESGRTPNSTVCLVRVTSLDLSFNQFFKDFSLHQLISYLERKAIELIDSKCKADEPILSKLK